MTQARSMPGERLSNGRQLVRLSARRWPLGKSGAKMLAQSRTLNDALKKYKEEGGQESVAGGGSSCALKSMLPGQESACWWIWMCRT